MLTRLCIENLALIDSLEVEFGKGLCLLTGETGAGKSILIGALGLATGSRADVEMVRAGADEAKVEASFSPPSMATEITRLLGSWQVPFDGEIIVRRRVHRAGRNTCTVNGCAITLAQLKELGAFLANIHGQHQSQGLLEEETHRALLDALPEVAPLSSAVTAAHATLSASVTRLKTLQRSSAEREQRLDTARFQRDEIARVDPRAGEDQDLRVQLSRLQNAGRIVEDASAVAQVLRDAEVSACSLAHGALKRLDDLAQVDPAWQPFSRDLMGAASVLATIASEAERAAGTTTFDPEALERANQRQSDFDRLKGKYGPSLDDVIAHRAALDTEIGTLSGAAASPEAARAQVGADFKAYTLAAQALSSARKRAASALSARVQKELRPLALEKASFGIELVPVAVSEPSDARSEGLEDVRFLFSANPGEAPRPLAKIASGGELSRTLLALLTACQPEGRAHTLVFDEVDAGIGGKPAERTGHRLRDLAARHQVLCITHLPQIAAFAHNHMVVQKESRAGRTVVTARSLPQAARVQELARMLAGETVSETALRHAEELLRGAGSAQ